MGDTSGFAGLTGCPLLPANTVLIDVRASCEYEAGHLPNAISLPIDDLRDLIREHYPDRNTPLVVYCRSGLRAARAEHILLSLGYHQVRNAGGILDPASLPAQE
ncbi:rhodanese-related sulfurtransferase [Chitinivorax tropicus]|uniref:Rhodanese-related sulfurtransferase n=1 Tax=Chitinivorax tropicus TaxID=714531 RepID=A0A840MQI9_9PROT|nr:rhodanese-like domain-containing protein [Chitinivorax tropicus]MBB5018716.1 rhodanese-related sulfurtransferase [Chitinivorax tropicus]